MKASYDAIANAYNTTFYKVDDAIRIDYLSRPVTLLNFKSGNKKTSASYPSSSFKVLELGCGAGAPATDVLLENRNSDFKVTGNDILIPQLDLARTNLAEHISHGKLKLREGSVKMVAVAGFEVLVEEVRQVVDDGAFVWVLVQKKFRK
ncbi:hypothetical protein G6011_06029 [Alternaria panax]|uniref:Methyltransferase domain-containing protein n=1 Tax=Alternaria panax TaxID=48097 RepID=A0AAD4I981_9PLEO|nr:hypothetical protein G6011_06029 [Alternaria panax]